MASKIDNPFAMKSISKKYLKSDLADVNFTFPNDDRSEMVPAHKYILAFASPVFEAMFFGSLKEGDVVKIDDTTADAFKEFLQLVYLPEITLTMQNYEEVLRLVDKYDMTDCIDTIAPFIERNLTKENLPISYQLAIKFNNLELKSLCEGLIRSFTKDFLESEAFLQCKLDVVKHVLQQNVLEYNEFDLFRVCMNWAKSACQRDGIAENNADNLKNQLGDCFGLIRFGAMNGTELTQILSNELYDQLFTREELKDFLQMKILPGYRSKIFNSFPRSKALIESNKLVCKRVKVAINRIHHFYGADGRVNQVSIPPNARDPFENPESTRFSTNAPILLKGIRLSEGSYWRVNMEIIEYNSSTIAENAAFKVLYKWEKRQEVHIEVLPCDSSIIINPKSIYEIRLYLYTSTSKYPYRSYELSLTSVKVNEKITITFHPNPSSGRSGLVSELEFYPL